MAKKNENPKPKPKQLTLFDMNSLSLTLGSFTSLHEPGTKTEMPARSDSGGNEHEDNRCPACGKELFRYRGCYRCECGFSEC